MGNIQRISEELFEEFQRSLSSSSRDVKKSKGVRADKAAHAISQAGLKTFYEVARQARLRHGLGVIGRARVAFGLQQQLLRAGYPPPLVKQVLFAMLTSAFVGDKH